MLLQNCLRLKYTDRNINNKNQKLMIHSIRSLNLKTTTLLRNTQRKCNLHSNKLNLNNNKSSWNNSNLSIVYLLYHHSFLLLNSQEILDNNNLTCCHLFLLECILLHQCKQECLLGWDTQMACLFHLICLSHLWCHHHKVIILNNLKFLSNLSLL